MPTYEYYCNQCDFGFEVFHGMSQSPELSCGECGSKEIKRKISGGAGIHFKGSGFYVTDYKNKKDTTESNENKKIQDKTQSKDNESSAVKSSDKESS